MVVLKLYYMFKGFPKGRASGHSSLSKGHVYDNLINMVKKKKKDLWKNANFRNRQLEKARYEEIFPR